MEETWQEFVFYHSYIMMANVCENISVNNLVTFIQILGGIEMKIFTSKCNVHNMESPIHTVSE